MSGQSTDMLASGTGDAGVGPMHGTWESRRRFPYAMTSSVEQTPLMAEPAAGDTRLRLLVICDGVFQEHVLPHAGQVVLGRDAKCDIQIDHSSVSRQHAQLTLGPQPTISDLGSANGTLLHGVRLVVRTPTPVAAGESIQLGGALVMLQEPVVLQQSRRIWPHGYFEGRVDEECARSSRSGACFAVLHVRIADVASFAAAQHKLGMVLRPEDVLGAYGPGEYEALLAGMDEDTAAEIARRLAGRLAADRIDARFGLAVFPKDARSADDLVRLAS